MIPNLLDLRILVETKLQTAHRSSRIESLRRTIAHSWIDYIVKLAKEPVTINDETFTPFPRVVVSELFFRDYSCTCCGRCCTKTDTLLFFTPMQLKQCDLQEFEVEALGFERIPGLLEIRTPAHHFAETLFVSRWNVNSRCPLITADNKCLIHKIKPLQCSLTPMHIDVRGKGNAATLTKRLFGRNWKFGCEMKAIPLTPGALADDLYKLAMLNDIAKSLHINTWLPELLEALIPYAAPSHPCWQSNGPIGVRLEFALSSSEPVTKTIQADVSASATSGEQA